MLSIADLVRALKLPEENIGLFESWNYYLLDQFLQEESALALTALKPGFIAGKLPMCDNRAELLDRLETLAEQISNTPALRDYYIFCNALLMHELAHTGKFKPAALPVLNELPGPQESHLFDLLLYFGAAAQWFETYRKLGVPEEYAAAPLEELPRILTKFYQDNGCYGYPRTSLYWMRHFVAGKIFHLGRFEYQVREPAPWIPAAYRSNKTSKVVLLARDNWKFTADGLRLPLDEPFAKTEFTSSLIVNDKFIRGTYIDPRGFAVLDKEIELDASEYQPMWKPWELSCEIHIPGGGGMTMELCQASLKMARDFFPKYLGWKCPFFWCVSWVFNPDIADEMPDSNIAALQSRCYLAPRDSTRDSGLNFVFGRSDGNPLDYPEDTSLRRAFKRLMQKNIPLKNGCMLIDDDGIDAFEPGFYHQEEEQSPIPVLSGSTIELA